MFLKKRIIFFASLVFFFLIFSCSDGTAGLHNVIAVYDGDTVSLSIGGRVERVRLIGMDAPEMGQRPWGLKAKRRLEAIINLSGRKVSVEYDKEKRDRFGRLLAYLWTKDGKMINLLMVEEGLAAAFTKPPNEKHKALFKNAESKAKTKKKGIWGKGGLDETPEAYRKRTHSGQPP